jgi:hypothetical protein
MTTKGRISMIAAAALLIAGVAEARQSPPPTIVRRERIVFASAQYGAPLRTSASLALFVANPNPTRHPRMDGWIVEGGAGQGGARVSAGTAGFLEYFGIDLRGVVTRTFARARAADAHAAYAGVEAGMTIAYVRLSIGASHRLTGSGAKPNIFTWSAALQIPIK